MQVRRQGFAWFWGLALLWAAAAAPDPAAAAEVPRCEIVIPAGGPMWLAAQLPETTTDGCQLESLRTEVSVLTLWYQTPTDQTVSVTVAPVACAPSAGTIVGDLGVSGLGVLASGCAEAARLLREQLARPEAPARLVSGRVGLARPAPRRRDEPRDADAPLPEAIPRDDSLPGYLQPADLPLLAGIGGGALLGIGLGLAWLRRG